MRVVKAWRVAAIYAGLSFTVSLASAATLTAEQCNSDCVNFAGVQIPGTQCRVVDSSNKLVCYDAVGGKCTESWMFDCSSLSLTTTEAPTTTVAPETTESTTTSSPSTSVSVSKEEASSSSTASASTSASLRSDQSSSGTSAVTVVVVVGICLVVVVAGVVGVIVWRRRRNDQEPDSPSLFFDAKTPPEKAPVVNFDMTPAAVMTAAMDRPLVVVQDRETALPASRLNAIGSSKHLVSQTSRQHISISHNYASPAMAASARPQPQTVPQPQISPESSSGHASIYDSSRESSQPRDVSLTSTVDIDNLYPSRSTYQSDNGDNSLFERIEALRVRNDGGSSSGYVSGKSSVRHTRTNSGSSSIEL